MGSSIMSMSSLLDNSHHHNAFVDSLIRASVERWNGTPAQEAKIVQAATSFRVLMGGGPNHTDDLERSEYAQSPILNYIRDRCTMDGVVYVAYVRPSQGKTTACFGSLARFATASAGLAFSPPDNNMGGDHYYVQSMMKLLDLDYEYDPIKNNDPPPKGWLHRLLEALEVSKEGKHSYLLLDDFMTNGWNVTDQALLSTIKTALRGKNVAVVVLTSNEEAADMMLSYDDLAAIRPLVTKADLDHIRREHYPVKRGVPVPLDWDMYVSMEWDSNELMAAALLNPRYQHKSREEKGKLRATIGEYLEKLDPELRKKVNPMDILEHLKPLDILDNFKFKPKMFSPKSSETSTVRTTPPPEMKMKMEAPPPKASASCSGDEDCVIL